MKLGWLYQHYGISGTVWDQSIQNVRARQSCWREGRTCDSPIFRFVANSLTNRLSGTPFWINKCDLSVSMQHSYTTTNVFHLSKVRATSSNVHFFLMCYVGDFTTHIDTFKYCTTRERLKIIRGENIFSEA